MYQMNYEYTIINILFLIFFIKNTNIVDEKIDIILKNESTVSSDSTTEASSTTNASSKSHVNGFSKSLTNGKLNKPEWVRLNIGGQCFVTTKTTLCKNANSFFYKLLQDDPTIGLTTDKVV